MDEQCKQSIKFESEYWKNMIMNISENSDMSFFTSYKKITSDEIIGKNALIWLIMFMHKCIE